MKTIVGMAAGIALAVAAAGPAAAAAQGTCTYEDHRLELEDGAAWTVPPDEDFEPSDWDGDGVPEPNPVQLAIGFGSFPLDHGALARATDRDDELSDQAFADDGDDSGKLVLTVEEGEVTMLAVWFSPGTSVSRGGSGVGAVTPAPTADGTGRIAGRYRHVDEDDGFTCDVTFDVPRLGDPKDAPPPPGRPLPRGGGEPGRAYLALNAAMRAGDVDALAELLPPDRAAEMAAARATPDFAAQLAMLQAMAPSDVAITGGRIDGDTAWLEFTAVEFGAPRVGTATLERRDGVWVIVEESTRDPD
jgi:hypothetical protein